jgi:hypothetical protein
VRLPPGATLVATAQVDRVRSFPEQRSKAPPAEAVTTVRAVDRVYQIVRPYRDTVLYFDRQTTEPGVTELSRDATQTSTVWSLLLGQSRVANVIVRNTQPTTIEVVSATETTESVPHPANPNPANPNPANPNPANPNPAAKPNPASPASPNPASPNPGNANEQRSPSGR